MSGHFIAGLSTGDDHTAALWHVAVDLRLLARCGSDVSFAARVPVIDVSAFSSEFRVCFTCAPEADAPESIGDSGMVQGELFLGL